MEEYIAESCEYLSAHTNMCIKSDRKGIDTDNIDNELDATITVD
jgi:hypothetical protein